MKGLPKNIKIKLLESDPSPCLAKMVSRFVERYRAIRDYSEQDDEVTTSAAVANEKSEEMANLIAMVSDLATRQKSIEKKLSTSERGEPAEHRSKSKPSGKRNLTCFVCNKMGHSKGVMVQWANAVD